MSSFINNDESALQGKLEQKSETASLPDILVSVMYSSLPTMRELTIRIKAAPFGKSTLRLGKRFHQNSQLKSAEQIEVGDRYPCIPTRPRSSYT